LSKKWAFYPILYPALAVLERKGLKLYRQVKFDPKFRSKGMEWPAEAETMIGLKRLDNLHACIETVISDQIPGDLIETGVWRGGPAFSCAPH
jgi:O-methyltransferase